MALTIVYNLSPIKKIFKKLEILRKFYYLPNEFKINYHENICIVIEKYLTYVIRTVFIPLKTYLKNKT